MTELAGPDALEAVELPEPTAQDGMVTIDVHAAGVSFPDLLLTRGEYQIRPDPPFVAGIECAGTVRAAPPDSDLRPGQRVAAQTPLGAWAEVAQAPPGLTFPIPDAMPFEEGAALLMNYHTALFALRRRGRLAAGETVLVHGAAGGVGTAIVQVAAALEATVWAVASGDQKAAVAREAGAAEVFDPGDDWVAAVREGTGGRGVDVIADPVGGERTVGSLRVAAPGGRLLVIGFASGEIASLPANRILLRNADAVGVNWGGYLSVEPDYPRACARELNALYERGAIRPLLGERHPLEHGAEALRAVEQRRATGKVVLTVR